VVGKSDKIIALLLSVDFFCDGNKSHIVVGTFFFNRALISKTFSSNATSNPNKTRTFPQKINALKIKIIDYAIAHHCLQGCGFGSALCLEAGSRSGFAVG
jgi:hypothetical protein